MLEESLRLKREYRTRESRRRSYFLCWYFLLAVFYFSPASALIEHKTCNKDAQCLNAGRCSPTETEAGSFLQCHCLEGYSGTRCEHHCPLSCQNDGVCHSTKRSGPDALVIQSEANPNFNPEDYECKCLGYFRGNNCEIPYSNCKDGSQCLNGGKCQERETHYIQSSYCVCSPDHTGPSCETAIAPAATTPSTARFFDQEYWLRVSAGTLFVFILMVLVLVARRKFRYKALSRNSMTHDEGIWNDDESSLRMPSGQMWFNVV
jgi:hypothetical protein